MVDLNHLEGTILQFLLAGDDDTLRMLRSQLDAATFLSRKFTGVGFFTDFEIPTSIERVGKRQNFEIADVFARISGLVNDAGFILFIREGVISFLEGFTFGDEQWPTNFADIEPYYVHHEPADSPRLRPCKIRDLTQLRATWTSNRTG
jgi:hypothetical protein